MCILSDHLMRPVFGCSSLLLSSCEQDLLTFAGFFSERQNQTPNIKKSLQNFFPK